MPAPQTEQENCVAHNGSLDPGARPRHHGAGAGTRAACRCSTSPTRRNPVEIAFFDRGPIDAKQPDHRRLLVGLLVQRQHLRLRDRARHRRLQADAERVPVAERDSTPPTSCASRSSTRSSSRRSPGRRASSWPRRTSISSTRSKAIDAGARDGAAARRSTSGDTADRSGSARSTSSTTMAARARDATPRRAGAQGRGALQGAGGGHQGARRRGCVEEQATRGQGPETTRYPATRRRCGPTRLEQGDRR